MKSFSGRRTELWTVAFVGVPVLKCILVLRAQTLLCPSFVLTCANGTSGADEHKGLCRIIWHEVRLGWSAFNALLVYMTWGGWLICSPRMKLSQTWVWQSCSLVSLELMARAKLQNRLSAGKIWYQRSSFLWRKSPSLQQLCIWGFTLHLCKTAVLCLSSLNLVKSESSVLGCV